MSPLHAQSMDSKSIAHFGYFPRKYAQEETKRIQKNKQIIMVWGVLSINGRILWHYFRTITNGPFYVEILQEHLFSEARKHFERRSWFQQDNDPKQTSRIAEQFLEEKVSETIERPTLKKGALQNSSKTLCRFLKASYMSKTQKKDKKFYGTLWGFCWQSTSRTISYKTFF